MPLGDLDPNASGRTSRTSNMSTCSRGLPKGPGPGPGAGGRSDLLSSTGVMSMLRTSTELGDIGGFSSYDSTQLPGIPRAPPRRSGASSRMSAGSSHSNSSKRPSSHHQAWPSAPPTTRRSLTRDNVPQFVPDTLSPTLMNLPGSSPLIPRSRNSRDGNGRSQSMTHTSQPAFRLSSNRSLASLRAHEQVQRPRSPYHYPARLRRPVYRPASPAFSDVSGTRPRRSHGQSGHSMHSRLRNPSGSSVHREDRVPMHGHPYRNRSPAYFSGPHPDIPPVPPLHHHALVEQARMAHTPAKASISSRSTNQPTDSDAPSSDAPSPPTPKDGTSMEVLVSPTGTQALVGKMSGHRKAEATTGPLYYDGSEQFEPEPYSEPEAETVPTGFVYRIKTILEERGTAETPQKKVDAPVVEEVVELPAAEAIGIAELPASPVARRITRDMVLAALEPSSTTEVADSSAAALQSQKNESSEPAAKVDSQGEGGLVLEDASIASAKKEGNNGKRISVLSQDASHRSTMSVVDSSTLDFAVQYSIPMVTGTEDGMSDLLDGYQHTESKQEAELVEMGSIGDEPAEKKSNHTPKSSDEQSFKSCTDLPEEPYKEADARSFKTCKDMVTPERAVSMSASSLPSMGLAKSDPKANRPVSEIPLSSPPTVVRKQPSVPPRESSFSKAHSRLRANSKLSSRHGSRQGSMVASISSSADSPVQQPPSVPPRESSSSKEAQRTQAVADFLVRLSRPRKFSRAHAGFGRKVAKDEGVGPADTLNNTEKPASSQQEHHDVTTKAAPTIIPAEAAATPEKKITIQETESKRQTPASNPEKEDLVSRVTPAKSLDMPSVHVVHQHALSTPSPVLPEPSSICSPDEVNSSKSRAKSSPGILSNSPVQGHRNSQSTTHLVWHGRKSLSHANANTPEFRSNQGNSQEETTTDLRLSAYRYPLNYLPDLKEESHEDSSINTSASNLKHSNFRFPLGHQPSVRVSGDEVVTFGKKPPEKSPRNSGLAQSRGLPSMNFSRMDLIAKLNEALDMRSSRSLDGRPENLPELARPSPLRPSSAGEIREKYRSFFASLDELEKAGGGNQTSSILDMMPLKRPYSPEQLMAEIDRLTIPSVGGLTQRLSEFLPSLKEFLKFGDKEEFVAEEEIMEHALEELNEVGGPAPKRSSARLRPMPGSPNLVVVADGLYEELTGKETENSKVVAHVNEEAEEGAGESVTAKTNSTLDAGARERTPLAELEAPSAVVLRTRSLSLGHQDLRPSLESRISTRRSLRSLGSTPTATETRPWNSDKNYPWAAAIPYIDISLPAPTIIKHSPRPGCSPLRTRPSHSSDNTTVPFDQQPTSPASDKMTVPGSDDPYMHARRQSRRMSFFSSSKRPVNALVSGFDASGHPVGPRHVRHVDQQHEAGERYPTQPPTPPHRLHIDPDAQSHFSDDSEEEPPPTSRKRKFAALKSRLGQSSRPDDNLASYTSSSLQDPATEAEAFTTRRQTYRGASGMTPRQFQRRSFAEKVRKLWHKSTEYCVEVFRTVSRRKRQPQTQYPEVEGTSVTDRRDLDGRRYAYLDDRAVTGY
ncbi:uncharacterized protein BDR25DRAFT_314516 [Lindgomyces ingoldianus]|uniref:Uncharacterized protein n=1 Tax=Lindgomyces ingoldianus TaxID=673940 RepID=A0ACB6QW35_9PLEO|nr:uncharacterized protein BDR25DRAFT_314516 [Lindgomyces ingoldianus]KAF2470285.1 hypothetical protein BDR25DRAFT_314516 [Lindgomyces ingoldianus]